MSLISFNSLILMTTTASNWPLTGNDSETQLIFRKRAAISFFGDLTKIIALTNLNQPPFQLMFLLKQFDLFFLNQLLFC